MRVVLSYRRVATSCSGRVVVHDGPAAYEASTFEAIPFARALELLVHALAHAPGAEAAFERTDRSGLALYVLDSASTERLRAGDPTVVRELSEPLETSR